MKTYYKCDYCGNVSTDIKEIENCEKACLEAKKNEFHNFLNEMLDSYGLEDVFDWFAEWYEDSYTNEVEEHKVTIPLNMDAAFSLDDCKINEDLITKLCGYSPTINKFECEVKSPILEKKKNDAVNLEMEDFERMVRSVLGLEMKDFEKMVNSIK